MNIRVSNAEALYILFCQKSSIILSIKEVRKHMKEYIINNYIYKTIDVIEELVKFTK